MSLTYVTKEKYNKYLEMLEELELLNEVKETIRIKFEEIFDFDPRKNTYSADRYKQNRKYHLDKSNGERPYAESHLRASNKYNERNREEINRKARERYQNKKELLRKQNEHVELTTFV